MKKKTSGEKLEQLAKLLAGKGEFARKSPKATCTITISETDGDLSVMATIPPGAENSLAEAVTKSLLDGAQQILNGVFKQNAPLVRVETN